MAVYRSKATLFKKLLATFSWILFGIIVEKTFLYIGVLRSDSISWYPSLDMFFEMLVILLTLFFTNFLYGILKKREGYIMDFFEKTYEILKPILPKKFDENEWFTIIITILVLSVFIFLHKRNKTLLTTEIIAILLFNLLYTTVGDYFLAMAPYDFYDTVDHDSGEIMDIFIAKYSLPVYASHSYELLCEK